MNEELKPYAAFVCLAFIVCGFAFILLSPLYSVILNIVIPAKPVYKKNSSILHYSVGDVKSMRKRHNSKVAIFGFSMCLAGSIMISSIK